MDLLPFIHVLSELDRVGIEYTHKGSDEVLTLCPFHSDKSPSCHVNIEKRAFKCHVAGCEKEGDFIKYLAGYLKQPASIIAIEIAKRYGIESGKIIGADVVERAHNGIWAAKTLLKELYERGITDAIIRKRRYGELEGRVSIPVKSEIGLYVNIRKYLPGAPGKQKMRNMKGCGKCRLYPIDQLAYDRILWCGGELKADVAAEQLNTHGIGAITATAGEGNFDLSLLTKFAGKDVYICLDIDKAGQVAAQLRAGQFYNVANAVYIVTLPLNTTKYPKGDINDFVYWEKGELLPLIENAVPWSPKSNALEDTEPEDLDLVAAINAKSTGRRIRVKAIVSSMDTAPYVVPSKVVAKCDKQTDFCAVCPVYAGGDVWDIQPESSAVLEMVQIGKNGLRDAVMSGIGIPRGCQKVTFDAVEHFNIEDVRISPQLEISNRSSDRALQPAMCIGKGLELNESYELVGRMWPHPKTQQSTLLISGYNATQDALGNYACDDLDDLEQFKPTEWTPDGVQAKLNDIYEDFEANVTRIWQRRDLHLLADLTYHSPLLLNFDGKKVKGWMETLFVGDTSQGKSEIVCGSSGPGGLMAHYGLGEKVEAKNATVAGLLGGLQQTGNRFWVSWGFLPMHDKRLIIIEELKGMNPETFAKLTDMRSSGIAQIPKIEKRQTHARTRLIVNSNSLSGMNASTYNFGVELIRELIPGLEDIRRFDAFYIVNRDDVSREIINKKASERATVPHVYNGPLCRKLVLWGWTRPAEKVIFDDKAIVHVLQASTALSEKFSDAIPIFDRGSGRYKLARLSAALACRTFSYGDRETIVVRDCHVEYIVNLLMRIYGSHTFGYEDYTRAMAITSELIDSDNIVKRIESLPFPADFVKQILHTNKMDLQDIQDWCGWDRMEATQLLSFFVRKHALRRDGRAYRKTPPFIKLLKDTLDGGKLTDRPDFIPESEY